MFESRHHSELVGSCIEAGFRFCGRDVADGLEQAAVVEPVDPFEGGVFHGIEAAPGATAVDDLGLEQPVDRLGQGVVIAVANTSDRRLYPCFGEAFGVFDRYVLATPIAMVDEAAPMGRPALVDRLLQGIQHKAGVGCAADPPANNIAGIDVVNPGAIIPHRSGQIS